MNPTDMADWAVVRVAVGAWLFTVVLSLVALLTSAVLPRWVSVDIDGGAKVQQVDVGLWQSCQTYGDCTYNCTALNSSAMTGDEITCRLIFQAVFRQSL